MPQVDKATFLPIIFWTFVLYIGGFLFLNSTYLYTLISTMKLSFKRTGGKSASTLVERRFISTPTPRFSLEFHCKPTPGIPFYNEPKTMRKLTAPIMRTATKTLEQMRSFNLNFGPQHPSAHGALIFWFDPWIIVTGVTECYSAALASPWIGASLGITGVTVVSGFLLHRYFRDGTDVEINLYSSEPSETLSEYATRAQELFSTTEVYNADVYACTSLSKLEGLYRTGALAVENASEYPTWVSSVSALGTRIASLNPGQRCTFRRYNPEYNQHLTVVDRLLDRGTTAGELLLNLHTQVGLTLQYWTIARPLNSVALSLAGDLGFFSYQVMDSTTVFGKYATVLLVLLLVTALIGILLITPTTSYNSVVSEISKFGASPLQAKYIYPTLLFYTITVFGLITLHVLSLLDLQEQLDAAAELRRAAALENRRLTALEAAANRRAAENAFLVAGALIIALYMLYGDFNYDYNDYYYGRGFNRDFNYDYAVDLDLDIYDYISIDDLSDLQVQFILSLIDAY